MQRRRHLQRGEVRPTDRGVEDGRPDVQEEVRGRGLRPQRPPLRRRGTRRPVLPQQHRKVFCGTFSFPSRAVSSCDLTLDVLSDTTPRRTSGAVTWPRRVRVARASGWPFSTATSMPSEDKTASRVSTLSKGFTTLFY